MKVDARHILKNYGIIIAFVLICIMLSITSPVFLTTTNIINVIRQTSIYGIMAVGMTFIILTGGIDLSIGSIMAIAGAVCAGLLKEGHSIALVIPATLAVGILCGLTNGLVVTIGKITPFVATLGMMSIARGFTLIYTKGYPISGFSPDFRFIGGGYLFGCPIPIVIFLAVVVIAYVILAQTRVGRYTYAIGGNEDTVILSGINSGFCETLVYVIAGASAA